MIAESIAKALGGHRAGATWMARLLGDPAACSIPTPHPYGPCRARPATCSSPPADHHPACRRRFRRHEIDRWHDGKVHGRGKRSSVTDLRPLEAVSRPPGRSTGAFFRQAGKPIEEAYAG
jgi:hypothetical protein